MRINRTERLLLLCTAACLLFCFGCFFGTNQITRGVRVDSASSVPVADEAASAPSNEHRMIVQEEKDGLIDINRADREALISLPGIGEVLAGRILDYRAEHGDFHSVQELTKVEGIGEKTLAKLLDYITVEGT